MTMNNSRDAHAFALYKPCLFLPLPKNQLLQNTKNAYCPVTGHIYCLTTGCLSQSTMPFIPVSTNIQLLPQGRNIHSDYPSAVSTLSQPLPNEEKQEIVMPEAQKNKTKATLKKGQDTQSTDPPAIIHSSKTKHKPHKQKKPLLPDRKKKTVNVKNAQDQSKQWNNPAMKATPPGKKPLHTANKTNLTSQSIQTVKGKDTSRLLSNTGQSKKSKRKERNRNKKQNKQSTTTKDKENTNKVSQGIKPNPPQRLVKVLKKKKPISLWSILKPFNRRPRLKPSSRHYKKKSVWVGKCKNCILASSVHEIIHSPYVKTNKPMPISELRVMLSSGGRKLIPHQRWMKSMEEEAIHKYKKMKSESKQKVQVSSSNVLSSHPEKSWLLGFYKWAVDRCTKENWPLVVNCSYKYPDSTLRQASRHHTFCLRWNGISYSLKSDHAYYTQMQCLLAITDKVYAELLVHTHKESTIVPVYFDPDFWEEVEMKLETFFTQNVLPYLRDNKSKSADPPQLEKTETDDELARLPEIYQAVDEKHCEELVSYLV